MIYRSQAPLCYVFSLSSYQSRQAHLLAFSQFIFAIKIKSCACKTFACYCIMKSVNCFIYKLLSYFIHCFYSCYFDVHFMLIR